MDLYMNRGALSNRVRPGWSVRKMLSCSLHPFDHMHPWFHSANDEAVTLLVDTGEGWLKTTWEVPGI